MSQPDIPVPSDGLLVTHFLVVADQDRSRRFYADVLGGKVISPKDPCMIQLANSWIILNSGGGPTPDKPEVVLEPISEPNRINSFLNLRVADIQDCYRRWRSLGAEFLTEPLDNRGWELRCYLRDPDGYLIEVGQATEKMIAHLSGRRTD